MGVAAKYKSTGKKCGFCPGSDIPLRTMNLYFKHVYIGVEKMPVFFQVSFPQKKKTLTQFIIFLCVCVE